MIAKLLIVVFVVTACVIWLRNKRGLRFIKRAQAARRAFGFRMPQREPEAQLIVPCAVCGLYLPKNEALMGAEQKYYCCEAHRKNGK